MPTIIKTIINALGEYLCERKRELIRSVATGYIRRLQAVKLLLLDLIPALSLFKLLIY